MTSKKTSANLLRDYLNLGVGIVLAIVIGFVSITKYTEILKINPEHAYLSLFLLGITCIFVFGWLYFDYQEIFLYEEYMNGDRLAKRDLSSFILTLFCAIALGILLTIADNLFLYLPLAIVMFIFSAMANSHIRKKLMGVYNTLPKNKDSPTKEICKMFKVRPFVTLDVITIILLAIVYAFVLYTRRVTNDTFLIVDYLIVCLTIIVHEVIVWIWRTKRNKRILELEEAAKAKHKLRKPKSTERLIIK